MRNIWKILAVLTIIAVLLSALFLTVSADNETGDTTEETTTTGETNGEGGDTTEETTTTGETTGETGDTTEETTTTGETTDETGDTTEETTTTGETTDENGNESTEPTPVASTSATKPSAIPTPTPATRPTATTSTSSVISTTATEVIDEIILPITTQQPTIHTPTEDTTENTDSGIDLPFEIGDVVLYSLIAVVIFVGGGVAIYLITTYQVNNNRKH